jgi:serine/threonine protein kinase
MDCPNRINIKKSRFNCKWVIGKEIGRGDQGAVVYELTCPSMKDQRFAIKVFDNTFGEDYLDEFVNYITKEVAIYDKLDKLNLTHTCVPVLEAYVCREHGAYIIMERRDLSVEDYVVAAILDWNLDKEFIHKQIDNVLASVGTLVANLHSKKIMHGDLIPHNIMVNVDKNHKAIDIALIDFSMAQEVRSQAYADDNEEFIDIKLSFNRLHDMVNQPSLAITARSLKKGPKAPTKKSTVKRTIETAKKPVVPKTAMKSTMKSISFSSPMGNPSFDSPSSKKSPKGLLSFDEIIDEEEPEYSSTPKKTNRKLF